MIRFPSDLTVLHLKEFIRQRLSLGFEMVGFTVFSRLLLFSYCFSLFSIISDDVTLQIS